MTLNLDREGEGILSVFTEDFWSNAPMIGREFDRLPAGLRGGEADLYSWNRVYAVITGSVLAYTAVALGQLKNPMVYGLLPSDLGEPVTQELIFTDGKLEFPNGRSNCPFRIPLLPPKKEGSPFEEARARFERVLDDWTTERISEYRMETDSERGNGFRTNNCTDFLRRPE